MATSLAQSIPAQWFLQMLADIQADADPLGKKMFFSESWSKAVPCSLSPLWAETFRAVHWLSCVTEKQLFISLPTPASWEPLTQILKS